MYVRIAVVRASLHAFALAVAAFAATGAHGASDCFEPLRANAGWSCRADLPDGQVVDYCLERTNVFGADPGSRHFRLNATGPYPSSCSCGAKGQLPGAAFGEDTTYLCLYRDTDAVVSGKITKRRISGQTFSAAYNLRTTFSCEPDPACDVTRVVDADLRAESGSLPLAATRQVKVDVIAGGDVALGYLPGCGGYASEAPTFVYRVGSSTPGSLEFEFSNAMGETDQAGILVVTPFGEAHCADREVVLPAEPGSYSVWVRAQTPGAPVEGSVDGFYRVP
jgi:hypothetical protein